MRIKNISIRGLFDTFDHEIPLFQHEPITIIHGPNGVGKTSILKLISGCLRPPHRLLRSVPFTNLSLTFDDESILEVAPEIVTNEHGAFSGHLRAQRSRQIFHFNFMGHGQADQTYAHTGSRPAHLPRIEQFLPMLTRMRHDEWYDRQTEEILQFDDVIQRYGSDLPEEFRAGEECPPWLQEIQQSTQVHFIETQRLLRIKSATPHHSVRQETTVNQCAEELAGRINEILATSATLSQTLERSFPTRLISGAGTGPLSEEHTRLKLTALDQKRSRLVAAGLLEPSNEPTLPTKRFDDTTQRVLGVYITDTERKLSVFDDMLSRIELIRSIVDARFLQKTVSIDRREGLVARTRDGRRLELSGLSSGEQHELVLLYELLFRAEEGTLILIDEPELSLHIAWQQQFLRDLLRITKLAKLTALVATHSPQIIHDRWDLTVELLGPSR